MLDEEIDEFINKWKDSVYRDGDITEAFREDLKFLVASFASSAVMDSDVEKEVMDYCSSRVE